jgi:phage-related protein
VTTPGNEGQAFIEVHADTSPFVPEAERGIRRGAEQVEDDLELTGDKWGETLTDAMGDRIEKEAPQLARSLERGLERQKVTVKTRVVYDKDGNAIKRFVETTTTAITKELTDAFNDAGNGPGGFGKVGQALSDAIGAGFNVSGRSPLIGFLIPIIGAIVGLVIAAIQIVNSLVAVLITIPGILASIGIQVGVLMVAFEGVGTAVQGAFAAKNAKELKAALQGLTPAAQDFVKSLLPLKDFFTVLKQSTQESFFKALGDDLIPQLLKFQGGRIFTGFRDVATALGTLFHDLGFFFNSDTFSKFLDEVFPRTITFLEQFGPSFITFLEGLLNLANAAMPFMTEVGGIISMVFKQLGDFFTATANDPEFLDWLTEMRDTLDEVVTFIKVAFVFIGQLMDSINQAGGEDVITQLSLSLAMIGDFLSSDVGISAMKAFINIAILSIQTITGVIIAILAIAGAAQKVWDILTHDLLPAIGDFFGAVGRKISEFWNGIVAAFNRLTDGASRSLINVKNFVQNFFSNAASWLFEAGKNLIQGLINGIREKFGPLGNAMFGIAGVVANYIPHSPAKEGPLSGKGDPMLAGQTIVTRLAAGMEMEAPKLQDASATATSNITFGPNSIQMRFSGIPTPEQAMAAGSAVGQGIYTGLARDTRLAIRTL